MEDQKLKHGVFMYHVLSGLEGAADRDRNGRVSLTELYQYTNLETKKYVARVFNDSQRPGLKGELSDDFELGLASARLAEKLTSPSGLQLTLIPAGAFPMGSAESVTETLNFARRTSWTDAKPDDFGDEHPRHRVRITRPFYLGTYEVTKGQFRKFVNATGYKTEAETDGIGGMGYTGDDKQEPFKADVRFNWRNWGVDQSDESPVVNVSWNDAVAFCKWLSRNEGVTYRLTTEAEWEYACRAGSNARYSFGDDPEDLVRVGNVLDSTAKVRWQSHTIGASDGYAFTCPAGRFKPNAFGLYDMHGNAEEWCADWYDKDYYAHSPGDDPPGPSTGSFRVLRGGNWHSDPTDCRSAIRIKESPSRRNCTLGFRVARNSSP